MTELSELAGLPTGSLSKIENGLYSPSSSLLKRLAIALEVAVPDFFFEDDCRENAIFVSAGSGAKVFGRSSHAGQANTMLGRRILERAFVESCITTIDKVSVPHSHTGAIFLYMVEGRMDYMHDNVIYPLGPGDSLFFDAEATHGPDEILEKPVRFFSIIANSS